MKGRAETYLFDGRIIQEVGSELLHHSNQSCAVQHSFGDVLDAVWTVLEHRGHHFLGVPLAAAFSGQLLKRHVGDSRKSSARRSKDGSTADAQQEPYLTSVQYQE